MYYILLFLLYPLSLLPFWLLYPLSDACCFLLMRVARYRITVVSANLRHAFPEKTDDERREILHRFYRSFCDQWIETLKLLSISLPALKKRMTGNFELFDQLAAAGRPVYALLGHQFNWEWGNVAAQLYIQAQFAGIYLPQNSTAWNRLMLKIRTRSGSMLISALRMKPAFKKLHGKNHVISFMADQTPGSLQIADWFTFLNRPAPFLKTPEKAASRAGATVVFVSLRKQRRGHYRATLTPLCNDASKAPAGEITKQYVRQMEQELKAFPENWMWTHRRWKHHLPAGQLVVSD